MLLYGYMIGSHALFAGLMLESALGVDLERFGDYQTRLVKLNPKLGGAGAALPAPSTNNTPIPAVPVTALSGPTLSGPTLSGSAESGIPPADQTYAATPGDCHPFLLFSLVLATALHCTALALSFGLVCLCFKGQVMVSMLQLK